MKLSWAWLKEWVADLPAPRELGDRLTMAGFELESLQPAAPDFEGVIVARIESAEPHPQADKLRVCQVNAGGSMLQIVCGAANARQGLVSALAVVGARLPGDLNIRAAKLRGVESQGMLCSAKELGMAEESDGIMELPAEAPIGQSVREYLSLDDHVLEFAITPNRGDAMSVLGLAREAAALNASPVTQPDCSPVAADPGVPQAPAADLRAGGACPQFFSRLLVDVDNARPTPFWLRERLRRAGLRSISPVVDVTNYIVMELGQPMHAYDFDRLQGRLQVRHATAGEACELLDGRRVALQEDVLVIADEVGPVAMAGVMGGSRTAASAETRRVLFEVAWFAPSAIAGRARRHGLTTDASQRFERGVDPALGARAIERATRLLQSIAGGRCSEVVASVAPGVPAPGTVTLRRSQVGRVLGVTLPAQHLIELLARIGVHAESGVDRGSDSLPFAIPSHRFDLAIERDLIEEIARLYGLDHIPAEPAEASQRIHASTSAVLAEQRLIDRLAARGFHEAIHFAFVDAALQQRLFPGVDAYSLSNPIASDLSVMRLSLWPGLLRAVGENQRRQQTRIRLFEQGVVFPVDAPERAVIAAVVAGPRDDEHWSVKSEVADFFDLRGDLESLFELVGAADVAFEPAQLPCLHPGRSARILRSGRAVGWIGQLHPQLIRELDLAGAPVLFELDVEQALAVSYPPFAAPSRYPAVRRDLAVVVAEEVSYAALQGAVRGSAGSHLQEVLIFDVYRGESVEPGRKSVALGLILQDKDRTLTDPEIEQVMQGVRMALEQQVGARIRE